MVPVLHRSALGIAGSCIGRGCEQLRRFSRGKSRIEIVEVERAPRSPIADQKRVFQFATEAGAQWARRNCLPQQFSQRRWHYRSVNSIHAGILQCPHVTRVAGQGLIAAFTGEYYGHALARQPRHKIQGEAGGPDDRLIFMPDQLGKGVKKFLATQANFMMPGADMPGNFTSIRYFTVSFLAIANRESLDLLAANFAGQRSDRAGVETTAQKYA